MVKKRTLNELKQEKTYGYTNTEQTRQTIAELINKYHNDTE